MFIRRAAGVTGGLLALFHLWLLGSQVGQGQLADPGVLLRWLIAVGLVAALAHLARTRQPLFFSRKGVAVWLLAAILHGPATATQFEPWSPGLPETVTTLVEMAAASLAVGLLVLAGRRLTSPAVARPRQRAALVHVQPAPDGRFVVPLASRPPPPLRTLVSLSV